MSELPKCKLCGSEAAPIIEEFTDTFCANNKCPANSLSCTAEQWRTLMGESEIIIPVLIPAEKMKPPPLPMSFMAVWVDDHGDINWIEWYTEQDYDKGEFMNMNSNNMNYLHDRPEGMFTHWFPCPDIED